MPPPCPTSSGPHGRRNRESSFALSNDRIVIYKSDTNSAPFQTLPKRCALALSLLFLSSYLSPFSPRSFLVLENILIRAPLRQSQSASVSRPGISTSTQITALTNAQIGGRCAECGSRAAVQFNWARTGV